MKDIDFQSMTIDELWALHETIASILSTRMKAEKLQLEKRIDELGQAPYKTRASTLSKGLSKVSKSRTASPNMVRAR
jgi:DNA-binding protein H-NS